MSGTKIGLSVYYYVEPNKRNAHETSIERKKERKSENAIMTSVESSGIRNKEMEWDCVIIPT